MRWEELIRTPFFDFYRFRCDVRRHSSPDYAYEAQRNYSLGVV